MADEKNPLITEQIVQKMAHLAKLHINEEDLHLYGEQLTPILQLLEQIDQVNTKDISPMYNAHSLKQRLREDIVTEPDMREAIRKNAPALESDLFLVPQVMRSKS